MNIFTPSLGHIYSGDIREDLSDIINDLKTSSVFVIADKNTSALCVPKLNGVVPFKEIVIKPGEEIKNLETCQFIWSSLIQEGADRDSLILNVGGGVICDMGGFTAACFQRGIRFGHIPTTVLAMADAAIGGKSGVDYEGYKNYIGLFKTPEFIWVDKTFLSTLPAIEIRSGLSEIVKHAIIGSVPLWNVLKTVEKIDFMPWDEVFALNMPVKVGIVESDMEEKGKRKVLNFGHSIGHALESYYLSAGHMIKHGECVALGMLAEVKISFSMGLIGNGEFEEILFVINRLLEPKTHSLPEAEKILPWLSKDKKKSKGRVGFSLPDGIGTCLWDVGVEEKMIIESYDWLRAQVKSVPFRLSVEK